MRNCFPRYPYENHKNSSKVIISANSQPLNDNSCFQKTVMSFLANLLEEKSKRGLIAPCFYTTGYIDKDFTLLPGLLKFLDAVLIDIRFAPVMDEQIQWRKDYLRLLLKDRYLHVPHLGNRLSKESGTSSIQNLSLGIKIITELKTDLLLMCECLRFEDCHRSHISQKLGEQGIKTEEITNWNTQS